MRRYALPENHFSQLPSDISTMRASTLLTGSALLVLAAAQTPPANFDLEFHLVHDCAGIRSGTKAYRRCVRNDL